MWGSPMNKLGTILPLALRVKLPYVGIFSLAAGVAYADHTFNLTSIFDPDVTGGGHQPRGRDQWALLYDYYRVRNAYVRVEGCNLAQDQTSSAVQVVGSCISDTSTGATGLEDILESPYANGFLANHWKSIQRGGVSVDGNKYRRGRNFNIDKWRSVIYSSGANPDYDDLYTATTASPSLYNVYFSVYSGATTGIEVVEYEFIIKIIYDVEFRFPVSVGAS